MGATTTQLSIANRALQLLGYQPISSLQENSRGARAINRAYQPVFLSELRSNFWGFSLIRASLPAAVTPPAFGKGNYFPLPGDFVMLGPPDQVTNFQFGATPATPNSNLQYVDYQIENNGLGQLCIATDQPAPLQIRYVSSNITENLFDYSFAEAFAAALALEVCEELTQSNTKLANLEKIYEEAIETAKKRNAFEKRPAQPKVDSWVLARM